MAVWPYAIIGLPVYFLVSIMKRGRPSQAIAEPSWGYPSRSIRSPSPTSRRSVTVPASSTPARIRSSTCARVCRSSTIESMPLRSRMWESSRPAGPAPMMTTLVRKTWVRMAHLGIHRMVPWNFEIKWGVPWAVDWTGRATFRPSTARQRAARLGRPGVTRTKPGKETYAADHASRLLAGVAGRRASCCPQPSRRPGQRRGPPGLHARCDAAVLRIRPRRAEDHGMHERQAPPSSAPPAAWRCRMATGPSTDIGHIDGRATGIAGTAGIAVDHVLTGTRPRRAWQKCGVSRERSRLERRYTKMPCCTRDGVAGAA